MNELNIYSIIWNILYKWKKNRKLFEYYKNKFFFFTKKYFVNYQLLWYREFFLGFSKFKNFSSKIFQDNNKMSRLLNFFLNHAEFTNDLLWYNIMFLYLFHDAHLHSVTNSEISPSNFDQIFANHCQREALDVTAKPK